MNAIRPETNFRGTKGSLTWSNGSSFRNTDGWQSEGLRFKWQSELGTRHFIEDQEFVQRRQETPTGSKCIGGDFWKSHPIKLSLTY